MLSTIADVPVNIRRLPVMRRTLGIEGQELARAIGIHPSDLSKAEKALLPGGTFDRMAEALFRVAAGEPLAPEAHR